MSKQLTPQRRKVVLLCAGVACMSGGPVLLRGHHILVALWIAVMLCTLIYAIVLFTKLKETER
ncbi:MAG: hypothetical protein PW792_00685 [Acidobacteriaceae bacterium]|nr:hypothetical protein [Acidobacteriaceae bacterium]